MFNLIHLMPQVQSVVRNSSIRDFQKIAFHDMACKLFDGIRIDATPTQLPVIVVDTLEKEPAMIVVVRFIKGLDEITYTFQFEVWPTNELQMITPPVWLPKQVTVMPKPKMKLSFLAERNSVVYFECVHEGSFEDSLLNMGLALGK